MTLTRTKEILAELDIHPLPSLSQNFLIDDNILDIIVGSIPPDQKTLLEIGGGLGALSQKLADKSDNVMIFEIDKALAKFLQDFFDQKPNVKVLHQDFLKFSEIPEPLPYSVIANIPYHITGKIIRHISDDLPLPTQMTLLVQEEVARRICSPDIDSLLTLAVQLNFELKILHIVSKNSFYPAPKVDSAILVLRQKPETNQELSKKIINFAKPFFQHKRKTLGYTCKKYYQTKAPALQKSDYLELRPEDLSLPMWQNFYSMIECLES
jgi:16S rRNA (adenine1518-N6/adenine1519-N6)-dimethyltransferase